jgi:hypothetical protein
MEKPSFERRESITLSSRLLHLTQRMGGRVTKFADYATLLSELQLYVVVSNRKPPQDVGFGRYLRLV